MSAHDDWSEARNYPADASQPPPSVDLRAFEDDVQVYRSIRATPRGRRVGVLVVALALVAFWGGLITVVAA